MSEEKTVKKMYGWKRQLPDHRDFKYVSPVEAESQLIENDCENLLPPVFDQESIGSCTANEGAEIFYALLKKTGQPLFIPSRLFIYYNERVLDHTVQFDAGSTIRNSCKVLAKYGTCDETKDWPYIVKKFKNKPTKKCYSHAIKHKVVQYLSVAQDISSIKSCIDNGQPIAIGFSVYSFFESEEMSRSGFLQLPQVDEPILGGHAVCIVAYSDLLTNGGETGFVKIRNSWGESWGLGGDFWMPYSYLLNPDLASDFWVLSK